MSPKPTSSAPPSTQNHPFIIVLVLLVVVGLGAYVVFGVSSAPTPQNTPAAAASASTSTSSVAATSTAPPVDVPQATAPAEKKTPASGPLPPLPMLGFAPPRPIDVVQAVFEFAARRPDVLEYVPCFCGCERMGHRGNDDCFVKHRDAAGNVEWEPHGMS